MARRSPLITRLVATSVIASVKAGNIIREVLGGGDLKIVEKGKNDLQTEADRSAQRCIVESLSRQFPGLTIIGEEGASSCRVPDEWIVKDMDKDVLNVKLPRHLENVEPKDICVWIDPLDGTSEYTQGLVEHVTVLIGVAVGDRAIGGVIHQPYYRDARNSIVGRTLWGIEGAGISPDFKATTPPQGKIIITTTRSHSNETVEAALEAMEADQVLKVGGAGYKVMLLLEGKAHAYIFASGGSKRWDTCGPEAILHAIGGNLTDVHGERYSYNAETAFSNSRGVLATAPGQIHSRYLSRIPDQVKQQLQ